MKTEKVEITQRPAKEGEGASFNDFMEGESHMEGGQHDLEPRGMQSVAPAPIDVEAQNHPPARHTERSPFVQDAQADWNAQNAQTPPEEVNWQKRYGDEANEKGKFRRSAEELLQLVQQQKAELAAMRQQYATPLPPQTQYTPPQQVQPQLPDTFFPEKQDGDLVEVKDVDAMLRNLVAPAMAQLYTSQQEMAAQQLQAHKQSLGLTPQIEQQMIAQNPWLQNLPDGPARIQAMQTIEANNRRVQAAQAGPPGQPAPPQQVTLTPEQAAARRVTYVETTGTTTASNEPQLSQTEQFKKEFFGAKTAFEKRKVLEKYGVGRVNDFGPEFLTR